MCVNYSEKLAVIFYMENSRTLYCTPEIQFLLIANVMSYKYEIG